MLFPDCLSPQHLCPSLATISFGSAHLLQLRFKWQMIHHTVSEKCSVFLNFFEPKDMEIPSKTEGHLHSYEIASIVFLELVRSRYLNLSQPAFQVQENVCLM